MYLQNSIRHDYYNIIIALKIKSTLPWCSEEVPQEIKATYLNYGLLEIHTLYNVFHEH